MKRFLSKFNLSVAVRKNGHFVADFQLSTFNFQLGQTLIETMAALFILVMGLTSAVGLAIYAFGSTTQVTKEIVATGLAREGLEAIKNMRDSNWLQQTSINTNCYDFVSGASDAKCYSQWLGTGVGGGSGLPYCIDPTSGPMGCAGDVSSANYAFGFLNNSGSLDGPIWFLQRETSANYGLSFDPSGANGFYVSDGVTACGGGNNPSDYCSKIIITKINNTAPYNQNTGPLLEVQSQVWWVDKKCPRSADWPGPGKCSVELDTYLTNWKNY